MDRSDRIVLTAAIVTTGSTMGASFLPPNLCGKGELPSARLLFGTAVTFAGLGMLSDFIPQIAGPLAAGIALTALTYYGIPILDAWVTGQPCASPVNNGRTFPLPASGAGTGGDFTTPSFPLPASGAGTGGDFPG